MTSYKLEARIDPAFNPSTAQPLVGGKRERHAANQNSFEAKTAAIAVLPAIRCSEAMALCMLDSAIGG